MIEKERSTNGYGFYATHIKFPAEFYTWRLATTHSRFSFTSFVSNIYLSINV